jgi:enoyl-CoA hydratase/carnithine racemase
MASLLDVRTVGRACVLTFQREEKLNALSSALEQELKEALGTAAVAESSCVVITGAGRAFSAGADLNELSGGDPASIAAYYRKTGDVYEHVAALPQPTVSAISGYCLGGGLELALATDFRVADESAVFGFPEVSLGIVPSSGGTHRLVRLLGPARAKELMLLRPRLTADEALAAGLVSEVVPAGEALARALQMAEQLAELPRLAVSVAKRAADLMPEASREAGIMLERLAYGMLAQTDEARAAPASRRPGSK